ncbi:MAG: hypothetical protein ACJAXV_000636 [Bacteroidia bacterium]
MLVVPLHFNTWLGDRQIYKKKQTISPYRKNKLK